MPDWFSGWNPTAVVLVAAVSAAVGWVILWSLVSWGWKLVIRSDERDFFGRRPGRRWSVAAAAWSAAAALLPAAVIVALAIWQRDASIVALYAVVVAAGLVLVRFLNSPGRRFGEPREA